MDSGSNHGGQREKCPILGEKPCSSATPARKPPKLAGDMNQNHHLDLFRQLLIRALYSCPTCRGIGEIQEQEPFTTVKKSILNKEV